MSNEELVYLIKSGTNVADNMLQLWKQTEAFVYSIAKKYVGHAELEDLLQEGYLSLYDAVDGYDRQRCDSFVHYAAFHIQNRMRRFIFGNCGMHIPEGLQDKIRQYEKAVYMFQLQRGHKPTKSETAEYMEISEERLGKILNAREKYKISSLDVAVRESEEDTVGSLVGSGEDIAERIIEAEYNKQLSETIWPMVDSLEKEQAKVIRVRYQNNLTVPQVAVILGMSKEEVICTEKKGIRILRRPKSMARLRPFLPEYEEARAYHGRGVGVFNRTWTSITEKVALELC